MRFVLVLIIFHVSPSAVDSLDLNSIIQLNNSETFYPYLVEISSSVVVACQGEKKVQMNYFQRGKCKCGKVDVLI